MIRNFKYLIVFISAPGNHKSENFRTIFRKFLKSLSKLLKMVSEILIKFCIKLNKTSESFDKFSFSIFSS